MRLHRRGGKSTVAVAVGVILVAVGLVFLGAAYATYAQEGGGPTPPPTTATTTTTTTTSSPGGVTYTTATSTSAVCNTCGTSGVQVLPPVASFSGYAGAPLYISIAASGGAPAYSYYWAWGDGANAQYIATNAGASVNHTYAAPGTYAVQVKVVDAAGSAAFGEYQATILSPPSGGSSFLVVFDVLQQGPYTNPNAYPVPGAVVSLQGQAAQGTNAGGQAAFSVASGTYAYSITASGFKTYSGSVTVSGNLVVPSITLTPSCFPACGLSILGLMTFGLVTQAAVGGFLGVVFMAAGFGTIYAGERKK